MQGGSVLLARRRQGASMAGYWEFPGGKMEEGETPQQCLQRELREELDIVTEVGPIVAENIHEYEDKTIHLLALKATILSGTPTENVHDRLAFVPLQLLLSMRLAPADIPIANAIGALYGEEEKTAMF